MTYKLSQEATIDIEDIWIYTFKKWSKNQADRHINLIFDEFKYVS